METLERGTLVNIAAIAGAALGLVSGAYEFISPAISGSVAGGIVDSVLWVVKLVGCIWIMRWGMIYLSQKFEGVTNQHTRSFGLLAAAFSALITAAATYIAYEFAFPDFADKQIDAAYQMYGQYLDSNSMAMMDSLAENFSIINFFSRLFWCFIYGAVLTSILSRRIPTQNPQDFFNDVKKAMEEAQRQAEDEDVDDQENEADDTDNEDEE